MLTARLRCESENTVSFLNYTLEVNMLNEIPELVYSSLAIGTDSSKIPSLFPLGKAPHLLYTYTHTHTHNHNHRHVHTHT